MPFPQNRATIYLPVHSLPLYCDHYDPFPAWKKKDSEKYTRGEKIEKDRGKGVGQPIANNQ
jgi:hypothetical protein